MQCYKAEVNGWTEGIIHWFPLTLWDETTLILRNYILNSIDPITYGTWHHLRVKTVKALYRSDNSIKIAMILTNIDTGY